jgi:SAM-dependent methyltransferase
MSYVPHEYWSRQGKTYKEGFRYNKDFELQEKILIDYLKDYFLSHASFSTVLEVGCGFGRITRLLLSNFPYIKDYLAIDLSVDQIENAKEFVRPAVARHDQLNFVVSDIQSFQNQKKYDLVLASEVLMHILPSEIDEVIRKLVTISKNHVINIDWYEEQAPKKAAPHNFVHQYENIYKNMSSVTDVYRIPIVKKGSWLKSIDTKQSLFHALIRMQ